MTDAIQQVQAQQTQIDIGVLRATLTDHTFTIMLLQSQVVALQSQVSALQAELAKAQTQAAPVVAPEAAPPTG